MSKIYGHLICLASGALIAACATTHPENPDMDKFPPGVTGGTDVTYYDVHGRTAAELVADMRRLGPKTASGAFFGETQSPMKWNWRTKSNGVSCTLNSVTVAVRSEITLPRWTPPADTVPGLAGQWKAFMDALAKHEVGHKDVSARAARDILHALQTLNTSCSSVSSEAKRVTDAIVTRSRVEQAQYDSDTRHGTTQGAVFPPRPVRSGSSLR